MNAHRSVQLLLDRLQALDRSIAAHRTALEVDELTDHQVESHRVAVGMLLFDRQKTVTLLKQTGWRAEEPGQGELL